MTSSFFAGSYWRARHVPKYAHNFFCGTLIKSIIKCSIVEGSNWTLIIYFHMSELDESVPVFVMFAMELRPSRARGLRRWRAVVSLYSFCDKRFITNLGWYIKAWNFQFKSVQIYLTGNCTRKIPPVLVRIMWCTVDKWNRRCVNIRGWP